MIENDRAGHELAFKQTSSSKNTLCLFFPLQLVCIQFLEHARLNKVQFERNYPAKLLFIHRQLVIVHIFGQTEYLFIRYGRNCLSFEPKRNFMSMFVALALYMDLF